MSLVLWREDARRPVLCRPLIGAALVAALAAAAPAGAQQIRELTRSEDGDALPRGLERSDGAADENRAVDGAAAPAADAPAEGVGIIEIGVGAADDSAADSASKGGAATSESGGTDASKGKAGASATGGIAIGGAQAGVTSAPERDPTLSDALFLTLADAYHENVVYSPFGMETLLSLIAAGSTDALRDTVADQIGADAENVASYSDAITSSATVRSLSANGIWLSESYTPNRSAIARVERLFQARVHKTDFSAGDAADMINAWISKRTEGAIDDAVSDLSPETTIVVANALFAKGDWRKPFDPEETHAARFNALAADGAPRVVDVSMMRTDGRFAYARRSWGEIVELPFDDPAFSYLAALPALDADLSDAAAHVVSEMHMTAEVAGRWELYGGFDAPRMTLSDSHDLRQALEQSGLAGLFDPGEALATLFVPPPSIAAIAQTARVVVDEQGASVAAASTAIGVRSARIPIFEMRLDRPFFFAIRHRDVATPIVLGYVADPTATE